MQVGTHPRSRELDNGVRPPTRTGGESRSSTPILAAPVPVSSTADGAGAATPYLESSREGHPNSELLSTTEQDHHICTALSLLLNIAEDAGAAHSMQQKGYIATLAQLLRHRSASVQLLALTSLNVLSAAEGAMDGMLAAGVVSRAVRLLASDSFEAASASLRLLRNVCTHRRGRAATAAADGVAQACCLPTSLPCTRRPSVAFCYKDSCMW